MNTITITLLVVTLLNNKHITNNGLQLIAIHFIWNQFHQLKQSVDHVLPDLDVLAWNAVLLVLMDTPPHPNIFVSSKDVKNLIRGPHIYEITWKHIKIKLI